MTSEETITDLLGRLIALELMIRGVVGGIAEKQPDPQGFMEDYAEKNSAAILWIGQNKALPEDLPMYQAAIRWLRFHCEQIGTGVLLREIDRRIGANAAQVDQSAAGRKQ